MNVNERQERENIALRQLQDDKRDHERFVARLKRLIDADLFDDVRDEVKAEYACIHGPRD